MDELDLNEEYYENDEENNQLVIQFQQERDAYKASLEEWGY